MVKYTKTIDMKKEYEVVMVVECKPGHQKYIAQLVRDGLDSPTCVKFIQVKEIKQ